MLLRKWDFRWCIKVHFEQSPSLKNLNATFFLGRPVCKRIFLFLYLIFLLNITIALSLHGCMFQYFFSGSFISLQMTFTARAAPSCIAWSEAFQRHPSPPLTPFLSFKTALGPTTRCTRKRTEKVHPKKSKDWDRSFFKSLSSRILKSSYYRNC